MIQGVELIRAGDGPRTVPPLAMLDYLTAVLARRLGVSCHVQNAVLDIAFAQDVERAQYYSSGILASIQPPKTGHVILAITSADLYVPVLTFVFGEAQLGGPRAIVSTHRLCEEFYGQPGDESKLASRLSKAALHEIGHTQGLRHCDNWRCVMASSHAVERLDLKEAQYCRLCRDRFTG